MNVIFLDIDGVMNHRHHFVRSQKHQLQEFCSDALFNLRRLIFIYDAKIVVSSSWRLGETLESMQESLFSHYDLDHYVIGLTPVFNDEIRGKEIQAYLDESKYPITRFIIIDDDKDMGALLPYLVRTSNLYGFSEEIKYQEAVALFDKQRTLRGDQ